MPNRSRDVRLGHRFRCTTVTPVATQGREPAGLGKACVPKTCEQAIRYVALLVGTIEQSFYRVVKTWIDHRAASKGAALALYTLFSMTPILVLAIAVAGYFFGAEAAQGEIVAQVQGLVGPNGTQVVQALLAAARNLVSGLLATIVASVLLLLGATSVFAETLVFRPAPVCRPVCHVARAKKQVLRLFG